MIDHSPIADHDFRNGVVEIDGERGNLGCLVDHLAMFIAFADGDFVIAGVRVYQERQLRGLTKLDRLKIAPRFHLPRLIRISPHFEKVRNV